MHAAMVTLLDGDLGRLMKHLESLGLEDDTLIFMGTAHVDSENWPIPAGSP